MTVLAVAIAGVPIDLHLPGPLPGAARLFGRFARSDGAPRWTLRLRAHGAALEPPHPDHVASAGGRWTLAGAGGLGWLDPATGEGEVAADAGFVLPGLLVRAALSAEALAAGGALVHAAAVEVDGLAHLCVGRSGAGKSTLAALARAPLSDELVVVVPAPGGGFLVHATPWWRGRPAAAPLAATYALAWDGEDVVEQPRPGALRLLAANLVVPEDAPAARARAFAAAARIAAAVPFRRLAFRRGSDVDALLRSAGTA